MSFTERSHNSWFARMRNAASGIIFGFILLGVSILGMFWNEGRAVDTYKALIEGAGLVVHVEANGIDDANNGRLVHVSGPVMMDEIPQDTLSGVEAANAVGLVRQVEMYQWVEAKETRTEKKLGGGEETITTYSYNRQWAGQAVDSAQFRQQAGHENPPMIFESASFVPAQGKVGAFGVNGESLAGLAQAQKINVPDENAFQLASSIGGGDVMIVAGDIYLGADPRKPQIGDMRVSYSRLDLSRASFVARQSGDQLAAFTTSNGSSIFLSAPGEVDASQMFADAQASNRFLTWVLRGFLLFAMFMGFSLIFNILAVIADVVPLLGSIIGFGTNLAAFLLTLLLGPIVIAVAWFSARPILAVIVAGLGVALVVGFVKMKRKKPSPEAVAG